MKSRDGLRLARHAQRVGGFPSVSDDAVQQFLVEEALMERLEADQRREQEAELLRQRVAEVERRARERVRG